MLLFIAYFLSLVLCLTLVLLAAWALRLLIMGFLLIFMGQARFLEQLARMQGPLSFFTGLMHGLMSLWTSLWLFEWLGQKTDNGLALFLILSLAWYDFNRLKRIKKPEENKEKSNIIEDKRQNMLIFDPKQANPDEEANAGNPFQQLIQEKQAQFQTQMRTNYIIQIIGRITGLIVAAMN